MTLSLRPYQQQFENDIFENWQKPRADGERGPVNVLGVAPTGAGKTVNMSSITKKIPEPTISIAHRQELVSQISVALAANEIYHRVIAADPVVRFCISRHVEEFGKSFHHEKAPDATASVQTIIRRQESLHQWLQTLKMWNIDEAHHVVPKNSWGKAVSMFPNAYGLGFTASPARADRQPLGRALGGMFDHMALGPSPRDLINAGYLTDYRLFAPTMSINRAELPTSEATGDFKKDELRKAAHKSTITGDMVENYLRYAAGKRGIGFVVDIEQAKETAMRFVAAGVKAMAISAKTADNVRQDAIRRFSRGDLHVLINVDLFGEGFDVPACEVVMMGRPTESFGLYLQQFGRALRLKEGKEYGIIIDHVGNFVRHGLPDAKRTWSLTQDLRGTPRGQRDPDVLPVTRCEACYRGYEAVTKTCPYCGHVQEPQQRSGPEFVDGDLIEISPNVLQRMRGEVSAIESWNTELSDKDDPVTRAKKLNMRKRQSALVELRETINLWGGIQISTEDRTESEAYRIFYHTFGIDVISAQRQEMKKMVELTNEIRKRFS